MLSLLAATCMYLKPRPGDFLWGVTLDNVADADALVRCLKSLPRRPTARIVFDPGAKPDDYLSALDKLHRVVHIMGEPIDSAPPSGKMTIAQYRRRMGDFMDKLGSRVDLWEIGNEINGDWTDTPADMGLKVESALEEARLHRASTALTLFYSDYYLGTDREMVAWSQKFLSPTVRNGVDYVLVSFYPATATGPHPDWPTIFGNLAKTFPHAKVGFGELGLRKPDFTLSDDVVEKRKLIDRYYRLRSPLPGRYIGGYFWWTFRQDAVGTPGGLLDAFRDVFAR